MQEVHTGRPETGTAKGTIIDFEAARLKRRAGEKSQTRRSVTPPPSQEAREERYTAKQQQRVREELGKTGDQPKGDYGQQQTSGMSEDRRLFDEIFKGETEEQINAHNEKFKARREREQGEKEQLHEEALKHYTKHQERLAAMTPEEREAYERDLEKIKTGMKPLTPEEFKQLMRKMHANVQATQREKAAWIAKRDPRYDPMTGDLLESDEFPLSATAEYYFDGATRPRRFIPPDSPHLKEYKPLQSDEEGEMSEGEYRDRLVKRLLKAGFTEVEPTLLDKALFEKTQWYRSLSPSEKMQFLQETMQEMTQERPWNKEESASAEFIKYLLALFFALLGVDVLEEEAKSNQPATKAA